MFQHNIFDDVLPDVCWRMRRKYSMPLSSRNCLEQYFSFQLSFGVTYAHIACNLNSHIEICLCKISDYIGEEKNKAFTVKNGKKKKKKRMPILMLKYTFT